MAIGDLDLLHEALPDLLDDAGLSADDEGGWAFI